MDTNKHSPLSSNLVVTANISLELLDEDGNVLDAQYGHNRVINDGLEWFFQRAFSGISSELDLGGDIALDQYAILLGTGMADQFYIPGPTDNALRQDAAGLVVIGGLSASYDSALQQISFVGQLPITAAGEVGFIREMSLGVIEVGRAQVVNTVSYRLIKYLFQST